MHFVPTGSRDPNSLLSGHSHFREGMDSFPLHRKVRNRADDATALPDNRIESVLVLIAFIEK